jgi:8-oxo-dGTP pyrophosphatase MutT (NUDIX family)
MRYLEKIAEELRIRPRVELYLYDNQGRVLASRAQNTHTQTSANPSWKFPGGGIEGDATINDTAKREALEEAGYSTNKVHGIGQSAVVSRWPEFFKKDMSKAKKRNYDAQKTYFRAGRIANRDIRYLGADGDTLKNPEMVPITTLIRDLESASTDKDNKYRVFDIQRLKGVQALKRHLEDAGHLQKTSNYLERAAIVATIKGALR